MPARPKWVRCRTDRAPTGHEHPSMNIEDRSREPRPQGNETSVVPISKEAIPPGPLVYSVRRRDQARLSKVLSTGMFRDSHALRGSGVVCTFAGSFKVSISEPGRESMSLLGSIYYPLGEIDFAAIALADPGCSFIGRELQAAVDWVRAHCERRLWDQPVSDSTAGHHAPSPPLVDTGRNARTCAPNRFTSIGLDR